MSRIAGTQFYIYSQLTEKAGDTLVASTVGTTETSFQSKVTLKANTITSGARIKIEFEGKYSSSAVLGVPTVIARIKIGSINVVVTPPVSNPGGATDQGFSGWVKIDILNGTATNNVKAKGHLNFNMNATSEVGFTAPAAISSVDFTTDKDLALSVQYSNNNAGNSLTLQGLDVLRSGAVNASN